MAADHFLLQHCQQPTLRLYSWQGPWVSLGYAQRWQLPEGISWVRRPSGGRAVLHDRDLTYAMTLPQAHGRVSDLYASLTQLCARALSPFHPEIRQGQSRRSSHHASCFELLQGGEILLGSQKLVGSAQLRLGERLLQHGSICLHVDPQLFGRVFPGAALPAALGPLTAQQFLQHFPQAWQLQPWQPQELAQIEEKLTEYRA